MEVPMFEAHYYGTYLNWLSVGILKYRYTYRILFLYSYFLGLLCANMYF